MVISDLTYDDLERSDQGHMTFTGCISETVHDRHMVTIDRVYELILAIPHDTEI